MIFLITKVFRKISKRDIRNSWISHNFLFSWRLKNPNQVDSAFKTILEDSLSNSRALEDSKIISFVAHFKGANDKKHFENFLNRLQDENLKLRILEEWANHCYRLAFVSKRVGNQAFRTARKNKDKTDHAYEILDRLVDSFEPGKADSEIITKIDQLVLQGLDLLSSDIDSRFDVSDLGWYNFAHTLEDSLMAKVWLENFHEAQKNYLKDGVFITLYKLLEKIYHHLLKHYEKKMRWSSGASFHFLKWSNNIFWNKIFSILMACFMWLVLLYYWTWILQN